MANRLCWPTRAAEPAPRSTRARGAAVEAAAREFLISRGLTAIAANATYRVGELDLVMRERDMLVFVEVRHRSGSRFGGGAQSITAAKRRRLVRAASVFLGANPAFATWPCRFDVVEAEGDADAPRLTWIRDAFRADD
jgi:putative endonuclease